MQILIKWKVMQTTQCKKNNLMVSKKINSFFYAGGKVLISIHICISINTHFCI